MASKLKAESLRRRADFLSLRKQGKTTHPTPWMIVNYKANGLKSVRYGWTFPKYVGTAVTRNRLRRWGREFIRIQGREKISSGTDLNIILRKRSKGFYKKLSHDEFKRALEKAFKAIAR